MRLSGGIGFFCRAIVAMKAYFFRIYLRDLKTRNVCVWQLASFLRQAVYSLPQLRPND